MCPANDKTKTKEKLQDTNLKKNLSSVFFSLIQSQNISMWSWKTSFLCFCHIHCTFF